MTAVEPGRRRRILFVDDEAAVLEGLRNLLRRERHRWETIFASSGKAALDELARTPVDVIVSDMRMPVMDGAELLTRVRELYPQIARIVLSGHAEREAIARVVSVAHQFLSKPTDATTVRTVIERTCHIQSLMLDEGIRRVVGSLEQLPLLPDTHGQLVRAIEAPDPDIAAIAKIIERDPAMSIKVLQLVNSAYFGLARKTESITGAVTYLDVQNLKGLIVAAQVFDADRLPVIEGLSPAVMRDEGILVGGFARQLVRDSKLADAALTSGIVHDIGHFVLARDPDKHYDQVWRAARAAGEPIRDAEMRSFGTTHGMVGSYLLGVWGLPFLVAETVAFHDAPSLVTDGNLDLLAAVHLADGVVSAAQAGVDPWSRGYLDRPFLERVGRVDEVPHWHAKAVSAVRDLGR